MVNLVRPTLLISLLTTLQLSTVFADTLFPNSVASNDIDFITSDVYTEPFELAYVGRVEGELPGHPSESLIDEQALKFEISFEDETSVNVLAHSDFETSSEAEQYANKLAIRLGKMPHYMRDKLSHVVIHKGDQVAFAEHLGHFFVLYSEIMDTRIENNDLEETVFHESVHATLDYVLSNSDDWNKAQNEDVHFITEYAESNPFGEDLAETSLFAYTYYKYPNQLPEDVKRWMEQNLARRLEFFHEHIYSRYLSE